MRLAATPFDAETGELLPVYRDAYLRGDLARASAQAVDDYLCREATATQVAAPNRLSQPSQAVSKQPRFYHQALSLSLVGLTLAGASMAASHLPVSKAPAARLATTSVSAVAPVPLAVAARTVLLRGRILNEQGQPLAGATVRQKGAARSTRTDASGSYCLRVPAATPATLQCSHNGYDQQETSPVGL